MKRKGVSLRVFPCTWLGLDRGYRIEEDALLDKSHAFLLSTCYYTTRRATVIRKKLSIYKQLSKKRILSFQSSSNSLPAVLV